MRRALAAMIVASLAAALPALAKDSHTRKRTAAPALSAAAGANRAAPAGRAGQPAAPGVQNPSRGRAGKPTPTPDNDRENGILAALERGPAAAPASFPDSVGWRLIEDETTGARLGLPEKLVPRVSASRVGSRWSSAQGQIQIETFRLAEAALPALFEDEKKAARRQVEAS